MATAFLQTNLVSDISGIARFTDPNLVNPWGLSYAPTGPFWVSDNGSGLSTLYNGQGTPQSLVVNIPSPFSGQSGTPTGTVFNGTSGFVVSQNGVSGPAAFLFVTEDGTLAGWNPKVSLNNAIQVVDNSANPTPGDGAVYKGLTMGTDPDGRTLLYATNFRAGTIDVFDSQFRPTGVGGSFTDPNIPAGFAPFDIANINGKLYVTYAKQDAEKHDDVAGAGNGYVDVFNTNGQLLQRLISNGPLNSPWGLALAPENFGKFGGDLLVGNFGDGHINAFNPHTGAFLGTLTDPLGNPIAIGGLWSLKFGNGGQAGPTTTLFFSAGIGGENHGLFGELQVVSFNPQSTVLAARAAFATATGQESAAAPILIAFQNGSQILTPKQEAAQTAAVPAATLPTGATAPGGQSLAALNQAFANLSSEKLLMESAGPGQTSVSPPLDHTVGDDLSS
jgi:uncharacterized protein (TIGR03118 family)